MENFDQSVCVLAVLSQLENGCIFSAQTLEGARVRVKFSGSSLQPLEGDWFIVRGLSSTYTDRFGREVRQIESRTMKRSVHRGALLEPWLKRMPNVGPTRASRLTSTFGADLPNVLADASNIGRVAAVLEPSKPGLAARIAAQVFSEVALQTGTQNLRLAEIRFLAHLEELGISDSRVAGQLWRLFAGVDAVDRLARHPYVASNLLEWKTADRVGQRVLRRNGVEGDLLTHPTRLVGAVCNAWKKVLESGDTCATKERMVKLLELRSVDPAAAILVAEEGGMVRCAGHLLRAPGAAWLEDQVLLRVQVIEQTLSTVPIPEQRALSNVVSEAEADVGIQLTLEQHDAVVKLLTLPVAGLQGGAGVGKTTVMKVLAAAWELLGGDVVMGALAGKAALTLSRGASAPRKPRIAYTVARLIGMLERQRIHSEDPSRRRPAGDVTCTERTLLVIDEAGMLDTPGLHRLLTLLPTGARILFAGDEGQLPPVGIGKFFHDLVAEGSRIARLTKILRQAEGSLIPDVAAKIRRGEVPALPHWSGEAQGVFVVSPGDLSKVQADLRSAYELMVVAAERSTVAAINESESIRVRPSGASLVRLGPLATVAPGDPVVMTTNRYQHGLFNGLLGVVSGFTEEGAMIHWDGDDAPRLLPKEAAADVELAYAITCHKAQGSSSAAVLVILEQSPVVTREWLYTAITRGRELVLIATVENALIDAVARRTHRLTGMELRPALPPPRDDVRVHDVLSD